MLSSAREMRESELASLLAQEAERSDYRVKEAEELLRKSRNAKAIEIDNAVKAALMDMENVGNVRAASSRSAARCSHPVL